MRTRFMQFVVDSETRQLLADGTEVHLSPKAFDLLCILLARRPNVVGKEQLLARGEDELRCAVDAVENLVCILLHVRALLKGTWRCPLTEIPALGCFGDSDIETLLISVM